MNNSNLQILDSAKPLFFFLIRHLWNVSLDGDCAVPRSRSVHLTGETARAATSLASAGLAPGAAGDAPWIADRPRFLHQHQGVIA